MRASSAEYWIYENYPNNKTVGHLRGCSYFKMNGGNAAKTGKWHGPVRGIQEKPLKVSELRQGDRSIGAPIAKNKKRTAFMLLAASANRNVRTPRRTGVASVYARIPPQWNMTRIRGIVRGCRFRSALRQFRM